MNTQPFLKVLFLSFREKPLVNKLEFYNQIYDIAINTEKKIDIPQLFFEDDERKKAPIKLYYNSELINECILEILFYG